MSARILVVDDILPNVKLLEAKLSGEYFDVITATSGQEALDKVEAEGPDIILLDIMMPGMDGFEVCERLKANPATAHIPVVMVTALTDATDRVRGLEAGADDFLSKPVNDIALMARVRSLVRLKMTVDEWKIRESTAGQFGMAQENNPMSEKVDQASILIVEDKAYESTKFVETLKRDDDVIDAVESGNEAIRLSNEKDYDLIVISLDMANEDGLRLCSHLRSNERTRAVPILMLAEESEMRRIAQGLDIGAHDYILRPVDRNEFLARVRTQIRRKRFQDKLRANYETSLSMAMMDPLTGLFNRRYLMAHFEKLLSRNAEAKKTMGVLMFDLDHFKKVNDTFGHQAGDDVLKTFAERITQRLRSFDLVARMGGEEFVAVLPDISQDVLIQVAERLRKSLCNQPVAISVEPGHLDVSSSIGAILLAEYVDPDEALKRADDMLYQAKENGRNCVWMEGVGKVTPSDDIPTTREEQMAQLSGAEGGEAVQQPPAAAAPAPAPAPSPEAAAAPAPAPDSAPNSAPAPSAAPAPQPEPQQAAPAPSPAPAPQPEPQQAAPAPAPEPQAAPPLSPDPAPAPQPQPQSQPEPQAAPALSPDPAPVPQPEPQQAAPAPAPAPEPSPEPQQAAAPAPSPDPAPAPAPQPDLQQAAPAPEPAPAPQPEPQQAAPALSPDPAPPPQAAPAPAPEPSPAPAPQPEPQQAAPAPSPDSAPAPAPAPAPEPQAAPSPDPATSGMQLEDPNAAAPAPVPQPAPAPQAAPEPDPSIAGMQLEDPNAPAQPQPQATAAPTPAPSPEATGLSLEGDAEGSEGERPKTPEQQDAGTSS